MGDKENGESPSLAILSEREASARAELRLTRAERPGLKPDRG
jgi:hypothetical protein